MIKMIATKMMVTLKKFLTFIVALPLDTYRNLVANKPAAYWPLGAQPHEAFSHYAARLLIYLTEMGKSWFKW
jgi:hypothetical protein